MCTYERRSRDSLGEKIASLRREANYTQEEMAEKLNVTRQAVSNWERNVNEPDVSMLHRICLLFGKNMDDLMKGVLKMNELNSSTTIRPKERGGERYNMAIGLFYMVGLSLGVAIFLVGGLLSMSVCGEEGAVYCWAASFFAGICTFFTFGFTSHAIITLKRKDK